MGRRKNSFSKAIKHLKSTSIDEKIEMLNEIPTMNTGAIYSVVPNSTTVGFDVTTSETNPDYSTIDFDIDGEDGKDTSGLFDNSGNSKFVSPPGNNSYILGPMSAMYYGWSTVPTRIGYIRESDRRMVNLASLSVKLTEWDGDPSKFTSYGQLTLEQALWFKDIGKKDGDSTHYGNYRAFYPGPPSGGSDAFGRYLAIIVGIPVATSTTTTTTSHLKAPMDQQASDNFSAIMNQLMKDKPKLSDFGSGRAGRAAYNRALREWEKKMAAAEKAASNDGPILPDDPSGDPQTEQNFFSNLKSKVSQAIKVVDTTLDYTEKILASFKNKLPQKNIADFITDAVMGANSGSAYNTQLAASLFNNVITGGNTRIKIGAEGRNDMVNSIDPEALEKALVLGPAPEVNADNALRPGKKVEGVLKGRWGDQGGSEFTYNPENGSFTITSVKMLRQFEGDKKFGPGTDFKDIPNQTGESVSNLIDKIPGAKKTLRTFFNVLAVGAGDDFRTSLAGQEVSNKDNETLAGKLFGNKEENKIIVDKLMQQYPKQIAAITNFLIEGSASNAVLLRQALTSLGLPKTQAEKEGGGYGGYTYSQETFTGSELPAKVRQAIINKYATQNSAWSSIKAESFLVGNNKKLLSESKKKRILKNIKKPVVIPETKQKSYKVSPGKKSKTNFQGMDKLVGDVKPQKSFKKPQDMWSNGWQGYNYRLSQGKKNIVLEKIGEGKQAWNYMLNHGTTMNAKNLEEFWGKNPDFYSYFFNGKKYRPIRKEQVKGDYIVFLVDEFGTNSSMLQSELNIKLAEEDEKKIIAEYNKLNNIEPISYENDPLFKKVSKRLKKEIDYPDKPAKKGYPNEPPPKLGPDGFHPDFGKRYKYDKLDPISATTMKNAPTGNPEIDANVKKASLKSKVKEEYSDWRNEIGKK